MSEQPTLTGLRVPGGRQPRPAESRRPARRRYQFGAEVERRARDRLRRLGYAVIRSSGSHGAADLVALGHRDLLLVQVRAGDRVPGPAERAEALSALATIPTPEGATVRRELWHWDTVLRQWSRTALPDAQDGPGADARIDVGLGRRAPSRRGLPGHYRGKFRGPTGRIEVK